MIIDFILVGIGGGIGAAFRAFLSDQVKRKWKGHYPMATFLINITGSFLLGLIIHYHADNMWKLLLGTGFMGGYTTFSTFHYEAVLLIEAGRKKLYLLYYVLSVAGGLLAAAAGMIL